MTAQETVAVLGGGSWGSTLAATLALNGHAVSLWEFDAKAATQLAQTRRLKVLPDLKLPDSVRVSHQLGEALASCATVVIAVPAQHVRSTMRAVKTSKALLVDAILVSVSKGLEQSTRRLMSDVIHEELSLPADRVLVLGGPSHAEEVCRRIPTVTVLAGAEESRMRRVRAIFQNDSFRVYQHNDVRGVELCGALKNVFAIACGVSDGLGGGDNTRAAILTRGLNEMTRIGMRMGAQMLTFFGLAGMGDLIVTGFSRHSRNHQLGEKIGRGLTPAQALAEMTMVAEGYATTPAAHALATEFKLDCPLVRETYEVLYEGKDPRKSMQALMTRETQSEWREFPHE